MYGPAASAAERPFDSGYGIRLRQMPRPAMDKGLSEETRTRDAENASETSLA